MSNSEKENFDEKAQIPEPVRARLDNLAKKLEGERQELVDTCQVRDTEVKALQTEMTNRESVWQAEKKELEKEVAERKHESIKYQDQKREWEEARARWEAERQEEQLREEQRKKELKKLQESLTQLEAKETEWQNEKLILEETIQRGDAEKVELKNKNLEEIRRLEKEQGIRLEKSVDEFERLLDEARKSWKVKSSEKK
ncbi:MAG: hypothetical protein KAI63_05570 [Planctomycetes bacterium]|nr:hypothetical protein [Planctomycetota bacterium]